MRVRVSDFREGEKDPSLRHDTKNFVGSHVDRFSSSFLFHCLGGRVTDKLITLQVSLTAQTQRWFLCTKILNDRFTTHGICCVKTKQNHTNGSDYAEIQ